MPKIGHVSCSRHLAVVQHAGPFYAAGKRHVCLVLAVVRCRQESDVPHADCVGGRTSACGPPGQLRQQQGFKAEVSGRVSRLGSLAGFQGWDLRQGFGAGILRQGLEAGGQ